ncbi:pantoate--beta-alanine ligase [Azotosporobacter soli]|uniref:pantoate--beta-alanine ligase n=1 Tax=Azotosporobacter soli TaxID=3055040 RepID=UPI0031FEF2C6
MKIIETIAEMRQFVREQRGAGKTIGFVPTMGALHQGHQELFHKAGERCDIVVASIFVNPMQFGVNEDLAAYPRDSEGDARKAAAVGVAALFLPRVEEMYPTGYATQVDVLGITDLLCGKSRPGHFRGVATVVTKLFNIVQPDVAFFGQKDAQQVLVLKRMAADLNMALEIEVVPIVREADGLALSSRNAYLNAKERQAALSLSRSLALAKQEFAAGRRSVQELKQLILEELSKETLAVIDYVEVYSYPDLAKTETVAGQAIVALAVRFGATRLIDNLILGGTEGCY